MSVLITATTSTKTLLTRGIVELLHYLDAANSVIRFAADADPDNHIAVYSSEEPTESVDGKVWVPEGLVDITVDGKPAKQQEWVLIDRNPNPVEPPQEPDDEIPEDEAENA